MALNLQLNYNRLLASDELVTNSIINDVIQGISIEVLDDDISVLVPDGSVTLAKVADGCFTADVAGRAKFADSFINAAKLEAQAVTLAKFIDGIVGTATNKATAVAADKILIGDSASSNATKYITVAAAFLAAQTARRYTSSEIALAAGTVLLDTAHSLGATPTRVRAVLKCTDAGGDQGWAQNDELDVNSFCNSNNEPLILYGANATNVLAVQTNNATAQVMKKTATIGSNQTITQSKWKLKLYAEL